MAKREIWHELLVNTSPERLYEAVAKAEGLAHWWSDWGTFGSVTFAEQLTLEHKWPKLRVPDALPANLDRTRK